MTHCTICGKECRPENFCEDCHHTVCPACWDHREHYALDDDARQAWVEWCEDTGRDPND